MDENDSAENAIDYNKLKPWNSRDCTVIVNSIRYNQDFSLLTLGTSKGYKVFLTSTLRQAHEPTAAVLNLGDINIAMTYCKSSLVFLLPSRYNKQYEFNEIIVFDDFYQTKFASFKEKTEEILNFFISNNLIYLITLSKILVLEILSFKIIDIINNINSIEPLLSFNFCDFIAYTELGDKKKIFIKYYQNNNHKISSLIKKTINSKFEYMQTFQLSPDGNLIAVASIFGNKLHLYYTQTGKLKECIFLGQYIQTIEKLLFSEKSNYLLSLKNDNTFNIYKINKEQQDNSICICEKYSDNNITVQTNNDKNVGIMGYFRKLSKNKDIKDPHAFAEFEGNKIFLDFDRTQNKEIILIKENGKFIKYRFKKTATGSINPYISFQWE